MTWDGFGEQPPQSAATFPNDMFDRMWALVPQLRGYLQHRLPAVEADDVIQDVFLRLFQRTQSHAVEFPKRYLFQVAQAVMIDRRRRAVSRCAPLHCELSDGHHPVDEISPLRILVAREEIRAAETALENLPPRTREIISAMRLEGASLKSLAARYNISTSAVEKHVGRALQALSAAVEDEQATHSQRETSPRRAVQTSHRTQLATMEPRGVMNSPKSYPQTASMEMC
jgi:RNA polymerase sigma-70 factor (ECF subfamily)